MRQFMLRASLGHAQATNIPAYPCLWGNFFYPVKNVSR